VFKTIYQKRRISFSKITLEYYRNSTFKTVF